jgi:hypothetical protein
VTKRNIKPKLLSWSALDSGLSNVKNEKLNPVEFFELLFFMMKHWTWMGLLAHFFNPRYLGGREQENCI